jgi:hypothetical protein
MAGRRSIGRREANCVALGTDGAGGAAGGTGGTTAGTAGSAGASIADASDVNRPHDAAPDGRVVDIAADTPFDCAAVSGIVYQGHCYYARSVAVDWNTASTTTCEAPAHLVTVTTAGEQAVACTEALAVICEHD